MITIARASGARTALTLASMAGEFEAPFVIRRREDLTEAFRQKLGDAAFAAAREYLDGIQEPGER